MDLSTIRETGKLVGSREIGKSFGRLLPSAEGSCRLSRRERSTEGCGTWEIKEYTLAHICAAYESCLVSSVAAAIADGLLKRSASTYGLMDESTYGPIDDSGNRETGR